MMPNKHTLVFLPGWGYNASVWQPVADAFSQHQYILLDWPENTDKATLHQIGASLPNNSVLIGWSLGGLFAIQLCSWFPEKFARLALVASAPRFIEDNDWPGIKSAAASEFVHSAQLQPHEHMEKFHRLVLFPHHSRQNLRFLQKSAAKPHPTVSLLHHFLHIDLRERYNSLKLPVLSLAGERDAVIPPRPSDKIIAGAGHALFLSHHTSFINAINTFLSEPE